MKKALLICALAGAVFFLIQRAFNNEHKLSAVLEQNLIIHVFDDLTLETGNISNLTNSRLKFINNETTLFITRLDDQQEFRDNATEYFQSKIGDIHKIFLNYDTPYNDSSESNNSCPEEYLPQPYAAQKTNIGVSALQLYADEKMMFGSCTEKDAYFRSYYLLVHCKANNTGFEIIIFFNKDGTPPTLEEVVDSIRCPAD